MQYIKISNLDGIKLRKPALNFFFGKTIAANVETVFLDLMLTLDKVVFNSKNTHS